MAKKATRESYGAALAEFGADKNIVVLDADLSKSTKTDCFKKVYPERFINVGIAEGNMMSVAAGLASKCEVQLSYAIGVAKPISILVDTFGTGKVDEDKLSEAVSKVFDLRPAAIIEMLDLRKPQYRQLAAYGHMGREDLGVAWEKTDKADAIKAALA